MAKKKVESRAEVIEKEMEYLKLELPYLPRLLQLIDETHKTLAVLVPMAAINRVMEGDESGIIWKTDPDVKGVGKRLVNRLIQDRCVNRLAIRSDTNMEKNVGLILDMAQLMPRNVYWQPRKQILKQLNNNYNRDSSVAELRMLLVFTMRTRRLNLPNPLDMIFINSVQLEICNEEETMLELAPKVEDRQDTSNRLKLDWVQSMSINSINDYPPAFNKGGILGVLFVTPLAKSSKQSIAKAIPSSKLGDFGFLRLILLSKY
ncbi:Hypothetical predicted protein [Olea europaea subsp. europaea]|uniref:Uncharacterized protein n=1 Tax=Olea europaea subsp. europaea TaxID=158383 RepID=A0A8S0S7I9_OLEEU|nr:Hypothetical predicted protein [Olea europaea subsp. europaea]